MTVHIYEGTGTSGPELPSLSATVSSEHKWHVTATTALADGKYTVAGHRAELAGQRTGKSEPPQTFEVFTKPPTVTLEALEARSNKNEPKFKGTASEPGTVTVRVFKGKEAKGTEAAELTATVNAKGEWSVSQTTPLPDETYTAIASEPSAIGNEEGKSAPSTFKVFTKPPTVKITVGPKERSNVTSRPLKGKPVKPNPSRCASTKARARGRWSRR